MPPSPPEKVSLEKPSSDTEASHQELSTTDNSSPTSTLQILASDLTSTLVPIPSDPPEYIFKYPYPTLNSALSEAMVPEKWRPHQSEREDLQWYTGLGLIGGMFFMGVILVLLISLCQ
jgi:hypothetical protein